MKAEYFIGASVSGVNIKGGGEEFEIHFGDNGYINVEGGHEIPDIVGLSLLSVLDNGTLIDMAFGRVAIQAGGESSVVGVVSCSYPPMAVKATHSLYNALTQQEPTSIPPDPAEAVESLSEGSGS